jgi:carboxylate-amine ligase
VRFRSAAGDFAFPLDPIPRVLSAEEHSELSRGLAQRAEALDSFVRDVYGEQRIVAAGQLPEQVISGSPLYQPLMRGVEVPGGTFAHVAGPDLVRDPDGRFCVLEDNVRSPSGLAYALEARRTLATELPLAHFEPLPVEGAIETLKRALWAAAPDPGAEPGMVLLSDGPSSSAWYEHWALAKALGIRLVTGWDLRASEGRIWVGDGGTRTRIDVIYRRTAEERLEREDGRRTPLGELLLDPIRRGKIAVVNAYGTGIADDKLAHAYVEAMIRFYLGQEPLLASVPTYDLGEEEVRSDVMERLGTMVVKGRGGLGGSDVHILSDADRDERDHVAALIRRSPHDFIAQDEIQLSTHPTVQGDRFDPRRVDLRPFVFRTRQGYTPVRAALTRYSPRADSMHVNSSKGGGGKDTWVIA